MELSHYEKYGRKCYLKNKDKYRPIRQKWDQNNRARRVKSVQRYVARNSEKVASYNRDFSRSVEGKYRLLAYRHRKRAWKDDLLSIEQYRNMFTLGCFYCGDDTKGGLDRADNNLGYSIANVVPCCELCNHMKWKLSQSAFLEHIKRIHSHATHEHTI